IRWAGYAAILTLSTLLALPFALVPLEGSWQMNSVAHLAKPASSLDQARESVSIPLHKFWNSTVGILGPAFRLSESDVELVSLENVKSRWNILRRDLTFGVGQYLNGKVNAGVFTAQRAAELEKRTVDQWEVCVLSPSIDRYTRYGIVDAIE